jgi:hypothetical protein
MPFLRFYSQNKCNFTGFKETGDKYALNSIESHVGKFNPLGFDSP